MFMYQNVLWCIAFLQYNLQLDWPQELRILFVIKEYLKMRTRNIAENEMPGENIFEIERSFLSLPIIAPPLNWFSNQRLVAFLAPHF